MTTGKTTQITLVTTNGESQIDGKTVRHAFELKYSGFLIGFTDGTWGLISEQRGNSQPVTIDDLIRNIYPDDNNMEILTHLVNVGVMNQEEADKRIEGMLLKKRERLAERIRNNTEDTSRAHLELEKMNKCSECGK